MTSVLLRFMKHFGQLSDSMILNQKKSVTNFVIQWCHIPLIVMTRNVASLPQNERGRHYPNLPLINRMLEVDKEVLKQKWVEKSKIENVLDEINGEDDISSLQAHSLLAWCNIMMDCPLEDRLRFTEYLWIHLSLCNVKMDISHYNALLQIYLTTDRDFSPKELLKEMENVGVFPNSTMYEGCVQYYCSKGNVIEAQELVKTMEKLCFPVTKKIYNSFITGYSHTGDFANMNEILRIMEDKKIKLSISTYTALMCAYAKIGDIAKIKELIDTCNINHILILNKTVISVIYALATTNCIGLSHIDTMYQYLYPSTLFSNHEVTLMLKLITIDRIDIVMNILSRTRNSKFVKLILQHLVYHSKEIDQIIETCTFLKNEEMCEDPLLLACYYSFLHSSDRLCLPLLKACKIHYTIKAHYFWPLLIKKAGKYDFHGILDILDSMKNDFGVSPCIETIADYVIPFCFDKRDEMCRVLIQHGLCSRVVYNAYVLSYLQGKKLFDAAQFMKINPSCYLYKVLEHELRSCFVKTCDVRSFVNISCLLAEHTCSHSVLSMNCKECKTAMLVPIEKQLIDFMDNYPSHKEQLLKILMFIEKRGRNISSETIKKIHDAIQMAGKGHTAELRDTWNKMGKVQLIKGFRTRVNPRKKSVPPHSRNNVQRTARS